MTIHTQHDMIGKVTASFTRDQVMETLISGAFPTSGKTKINVTQSDANSYPHE